MTKKMAKVVDIVEAGIGIGTGFTSMHICKKMGMNTTCAAVAGTATGIGVFAILDTTVAKIESARLRKLRRSKSKNGNQNSDQEEIVVEETSEPTEKPEATDVEVIDDIEQEAVEAVEELEEASEAVAG